MLIFDKYLPLLEVSTYSGANLEVNKWTEFLNPPIGRTVTIAVRVNPAHMYLGPAQSPFVIEHMLDSLRQVQPRIKSSPLVVGIRPELAH